MVDAKRPAIWFITGTDTGVGKTFTAALLAKQLRHSGKRVGVYKPVASGCQRRGGDLICDDAEQLWAAAGHPLDLDAVCPQRFEAPLAPNRAAAAEGRTVDREQLLSGARRWFDCCDTLIVEGAGGLMSPLAERMLNADLALEFAPVHLVIVVANRLGAVHQALATCAAAVQRGIEPAGLVLCETSQATSLDYHGEEIARYTSVPILADIPYAADVPIAIDRAQAK